MKYATTIIPLLSALSLAACGDSTTDDGGGTGGTGGTLTSDCVDYTPSTDDGDESAQWPDIDTNEVELVTLSAPEDPGGGYYEISIDGYATANVGGVVRVFLGDDMIASSGPTARQEPANTAFAAAPGLSYRVEAVQNLQADSFPAPVDGVWTFTSLVDCWEPNDLRSEAARFLVDEQVEAYFFAGYETDSQPSDELLEDWYVVRLPAASSATFEIGSLPDNRSNRMQVYFEDDDSPLGSELSESTIDTITVELTDLAAGDYYVRLSEFLVPDASVGKDEPLPENWGDTYTLDVTVVE